MKHILLFEEFLNEFKNIELNTKRITPHILKDVQAENIKIGGRIIKGAAAIAVAILIARKAIKKIKANKAKKREEFAKATDPIHKERITKEIQALDKQAEQHKIETVD